MFRIFTGWCLSVVLAVTAAAGGGPASLDASIDVHATDAQLTRFVEELLAGNPEIRSAGSRARAQLERAAQERALPDPKLTYRHFLRSPETRVGPQERTIELSQGIPWRGKLRLQAERAGHLGDGAAWQTRQLERRLVAELKHAYFDAAYLQEALLVNTDESALLRRFEQIALTRYSSGQGNQQSAVKAQTDLSRLVDQRTALESRLRTTERRIAALVGRPGTTLELRPIALSLPSIVYDNERLEEEALERNPGIAAARLMIDADESRIRRRHRDALPDFTVGVGYTDVGRRRDSIAALAPPDDDGKDVWALGVTLNLPLQRRRVRAGVAEAEHELGASRSSLHAVQDRVRYELQEALLRLETAEERAALYRELLIPQAEESLASAEAAYTTSRQDFLDLLDAERVLFRVRLTYFRLLSDAWISLADVERVVARSFPAPSEEGVR